MGGKIVLLNLLINLLSVIGMVNGNTATSGFLQKCLTFSDTRSTHGTNGESPNFILTIRGDLARQEEELHFRLKPGDLKCKWEIYRMNLTMYPLKTVAVNLTRNFESIELANAKHPQYFTPDGYFFDEKYFLSPKTDFCLHSVSDNKLELKICPRKCHGKDKYINCFPKCCALDEIFVWKKCVKRNNTEKGFPHWKPELYEKRWHGGYSQVPHKHFEFYLADIPSNCNDDGVYGPDLMPYSSIPLKNNFGNKSSRKSSIRFTLDKNGVVKPMLLNPRSRKWSVEENVQFCADAVLNHETTTEGSGQIRSDSFWLFPCFPPPEGGQTGPVKTTASKMATIYAVVGLVSVCFLLLTVIIYLLILDKLNLHGLTILSYCITELLSYTLLVMVQLTFILDLKWTGVGKGGWICYLIATSTHFFSISSYVWLLVMNFDLWKTFRSLRVVKRDARKLKTFFGFCAVGWGLPLILIIGFVTLDEVYSDPASEVPVPLYGTSSCYVANQFQGYYVYIPIAVILCTNVILILLTMKIFFDARKEKNVILKASSSETDDSTYSAKLFAKLFVIMGGTSLFNFVSWHYSERPEETPWVVVILGSVTYLIPIILFILFCLNDRTLEHMYEKFPRLKGLLPRLVFRRRENDSTGSAVPGVPTQTTDLSNNRGEMLPLKEAKPVQGVVINRD